MQSFRMWVPRRKGRADLHFRTPAITAKSVVHIAVSEATDLDPGVLGGFGQNFRTVFGAASITLQNVAVRDGAVDFNVFVDWDSPLNLVTDITVLDPPTDIIIGT
jgi:hypothetical protein